MAGPSTHIAYISDDGATYRVLVPAWQATVTGDAALATGPGLPKGYRRRHRMLQDTATGKQFKVTVGDITKSIWTSGFGTTTSPAPIIPGHVGVATHNAGRIGERDLIRG